MRCSVCKREIVDGEGHYKFNDKVYCVVCWKNRSKSPDKDWEEDDGHRKGNG